MNKCGVIISGGTIEDGFALEVMQSVDPDYVIGVDHGLEFCYRNQVLPTHIVGDFDSVSEDIIRYYEQETDIPIRRFKPEKDATDTEIAVRHAIELGVKELWLLGATGTRLDHVMTNIHILKIAIEAGVQAYIVDVNNRISLHEQTIRMKREDMFGTYFSVFSLGETVEDLTIVGAKYPLYNYRLSSYDSRCVSNEMQEEEVKISFSKGMILLMETRDRL